MFGSGVGWYTDALTGQSLPYLIANGLPTYSREYKSSASASQPPPGPHRGGDGNGARTSGSAPASMATISGTKRPVPETSGSAEVLPDSSEESHPNGRDNLSLLSLVASLAATGSGGWASPTLRNSSLSRRLRTAVSMTTSVPRSARPSVGPPPVGSSLVTRMVLLGHSISTHALSSLSRT